jgi:nitroreductase
MTLNYIDLIRERHSTRDYLKHDLTPEDRAQIMGAIATAVSVNAAVHLDWMLADRFPMGCSAVLYAKCGTSAEELVEYGYQGQQIVLALLAQGWGTCWYGTLKLAGSPCSITVGRPAPAGLRSAVVGALSRGHTRKSIEQLVPGGMPVDAPPQLLTILQSARLAPSAINRQSWSFEVLKANEIAIKGDASRFPDLGICLANAMVTARQLECATTVLRLGPGEYSVSW